MNQKVVRYLGLLFVIILCYTYSALAQTKKDDTKCQTYIKFKTGFFKKNMIGVEGGFSFTLKPFYFDAGIAAEYGKADDLLSFVSPSSLSLSSGNKLFFIRGVFIFRLPQYQDGKEVFSPYIGAGIGLLTDNYKGTVKEFHNNQLLSTEQITGKISGIGMSFKFGLQAKFQKMSIFAEFELLKRNTEGKETEVPDVITDFGGTTLWIGIRF